MQHLETKISEENISIYDPESQYTLRVSLEKNKFKFLGIIFQMPYKGNKKGYMSITCRDLDEYHEDINSLNIDPCRQYIEIGTGLGEFVHYVSGICKAMPIAIDPARYGVMQCMLETSRRMVLDTIIRDKIDVLIWRCRNIQDKTRIHLINMKLGEALEAYPSLYGIADVVIDNCGPSLYPLNEKSTECESEESAAVSSIDSLENKLLKSGGKLIVRKSMI
ncbi:MAG: hypothetical protein V1906_01310 [Candidatus Woesearchaeota archaeon]